MELKLKSLPTTELHEKIYQEVLQIIKKYCKENTDLETTEILAIFACTIGYCISLYDLDQREIVKNMVLMNMEMAIKELTGTQS